MKTKSFLITVALMASCFGEEPKPPGPLSNPEIAKIDARLAELTQIWKDDTAIINRLTNFKRTPVQQGSQAYYTCLKSSERIQQAEAEAKTLKQKKAAIEQGKPIPVATSPSSSKSNSGMSDPFAEPEEHVATEQETVKEAEDMGFAVVEKVVPSVAYEKAKHGPKVKDFFIGMSMTDCEKKLSTMLEQPFRTIVALKDTQLWENALANGARFPNRTPISKGVFVLVPKSNKIGMIEKESIFAAANSNGLVKSL